MAQERLENKEYDDSFVSHTAEHGESHRKNVVLLGWKCSIFGKESVSAVTEQHHEGCNEPQSIQPVEMLFDLTTFIHIDTY